MRYKVPQNIDIQDRILGPLTMIQFVYAVIGGGLAYSAYSTLPKPFSYIAAMPVALLTIALVFVKINERPFLDFLISAIQFWSKPKQRVWHHGSVNDMKVVIYQPIHKEKKVETKNVPHRKIEELAKQLDRT